MVQQWEGISRFINTGLFRFRLKLKGFSNQYYQAASDLLLLLKCHGIYQIIHPGLKCQTAFLNYLLAFICKDDLLDAPISGIF